MIESYRCIVSSEYRGLQLEKNVALPRSGYAAISSAESERVNPVVKILTLVREGLCIVNYCTNYHRTMMITSTTCTRLDYGILSSATCSSCSSLNI